MHYQRSRKVSFCDIYHHSLDGSAVELVFIRDEYRNMFIESIKFCQKEKGLLVGVWCIMTSHVHMIIGTNGENKLEGIIRDLKPFASRHIRKEIEMSIIEK